MKNDFKKTVRLIGFHASVLLKGFARMIYGATMGAMIAAAVYGFIMIPYEGGYIAVCEFLASTCVMCIALGGIYLMGGSTKKGATK